MSSYVRYVTPNFVPFNPLTLVEETEKIICRGLERKYTDFYATGVYRGINTAYGVGCCLRCVYCWIELSRDFPERFGNFYSPEEVFQMLCKTAKRSGYRKLRMSGCEPTLGREHLLALLELVEGSEFPLFILETNGIVIGSDESLAKRLSRFSKVHVRVSLKAGTPEGFEKRTGAIGSFYELPFKAIKQLLDSGVSFHVAAMSDPRIMPREERLTLIRRLEKIEPTLARHWEEEVIDPYPTTLIRLRKAGIDVKWPKTQR